MWIIKKSRFIFLAFILNILVHICFFVLFKQNQPPIFEPNRYSVNIASSSSKEVIPTNQKKRTNKNSNKPITDPLNSENIQPKLIKGLRLPVYPKLARIRGLQGTVIISFMIMPSGKLTAVSIKKSSGHTILDQSALEAALNWRFSSHQSKSSVYFEKSVLYKLK